jgi:hypothetical protein
MDRESIRRLQAALAGAEKAKKAAIEGLMAASAEKEKLCARLREVEKELVSVKNSWALAEDILSETRGVRDTWIDRAKAAEKALADWKAKCGPWFPWDRLTALRPEAATKEGNRE